MNLMAWWYDKTYIKTESTFEWPVLMDNALWLCVIALCLPCVCLKIKGESKSVQVSPQTWRKSAKRKVQCPRVSVSQGIYNGGMKWHTRLQSPSTRLDFRCSFCCRCQSLCFLLLLPDKVARDCKWCSKKTTETQRQKTKQNKTMLQKFTLNTLTRFLIRYEE